jgi:Fe-S cluster assembly iron-binding protein IscA
MLQITDQAKEELKRLLERKVDWPGARLRLLERNGGALGLGVDIQSGNDKVVEYEGGPLLVVESNLEERINVLLDVDATEEGPELVICEQ